MIKVKKATKGNGYCIACARLENDPREVLIARSEHAMTTSIFLCYTCRLEMLLELSVSVKEDNMKREREVRGL